MPRTRETLLRELGILVDQMEQRLRAEATTSDRHQIREIVAYFERISPDGSLTALANHVEIALSHGGPASSLSTVAVLRALNAIERLRARLAQLARAREAVSAVA